MCLTDVQRISKESIFSDLNNLEVNTPLSRASNERFGFTDDEMRVLANYLGKEGSVRLVRQWYGGYRFGDAGIYNPWSVLSFFANGCEPGTYRADTSGNDVVGAVLAQLEGPRSRSSTPSRTPEPK